MNISNIPAPLQKTGLFCCWKYEERDGRKTKVPYNPRTGGRAQSTNPETFAPLPVALDAMRSGGYSGIGVGIFGTLGAIDIDHCISDTGELSGMAQNIMLTMDAYTEKSPSGKGLRILFQVSGFQYDKARYYINNNKIGLEVYIAGSTNKHVTVTGDTLYRPTGEPLPERNAELSAVLEMFMIRRPDNPPPPPVTGDDMALIEKAGRSGNGETFKALWSGDISGFESHSQADLALCNMLAFWTDGDAARIDRIFRASGIMRRKWDKPLSGSTYGAVTIQKAIAGMTEGYTPPEAVSEAWEPPVPFDNIETPDFPTDALPGPLDAFVEALSESTQTPPEMAGILSLGILSTAFQSRYTVEINRDWSEPLCLYCVAVAPPGERKSAVLSALTRPVYEFEAERREETARAVAQNQTERQILEAALKAAQANAVKAKTPEARENSRQESLALSSELAGFQDIHPFRLLADDTTPEKLIELMSAQHGCLTVCSAEGGIFDSLSGRYDRATNLDIYLKGHAGDPVTVDRIGRPPNYISEPRLTMLLTIQPEVLNGLMENTSLRGRGLCGRFLYAVCRSKIGRREINPDPIPDRLKTGYREFVRRILSGQDSGIIHLSPEADKLRCEYQEHIERKLGDDWESMGDWGGKITGAMLRIAALFHAVEVEGNPAERSVGVETMTSAIRIAECLERHAEFVYQAMGADESFQDAKYLWRRIDTAGTLEVSKRDIYHICKGHFRRVEDMTPALQILIERGYIRETEEKKERGRPSVKLLVNPLAKKPN